MDTRKIADLLRGTVNPNHIERQQAEEQLAQVFIIISLLLLICDCWLSIHCFFLISLIFSVRYFYREVKIYAM